MHEDALQSRLITTRARLKARKHKTHINNSQSGKLLKMNSMNDNSNYLNSRGNEGNLAAGADKLGHSGTDRPNVIEDTLWAGQRHYGPPIGHILFNGGKTRDNLRCNTPNL